MATKTKKTSTPIYRAKNMRRVERNFSVFLSTITFLVIAYELLITVTYLCCHLGGYFEDDVLGIKTGIAGFLLFLPIGILLLAFPLNFFAANFIGGIEYAKKESAPVLRRYVAYAWMQLLPLTYLIIFAFTAALPPAFNSITVLSIIDVPFLAINIWLYFIKLKNPKFTLFLIKITRILLLGINLALILGVLFGIIESWKK